MSYQDQEYHRRRSEIELEQGADDPQSAVAHLELARLHRARRQIIGQREGSRHLPKLGGGVFRTDKEA